MRAVAFANRSNRVQQLAVALAASAALVLFVMGEYVVEY